MFTFDVGGRCDTLIKDGFTESPFAANGANRGVVEPGTHGFGGVAPFGYFFFSSILAFGIGVGVGICRRIFDDLSSSVTSSASAEVTSTCPSASADKFPSYSTREKYK